MTPSTNCQFYPN